MARTKHSLAWALTAVSLVAALLAGGLFPTRVGAQTAQQTETTTAINDYPALRLYAHDLTALARTGRLARFTTNTHTPQLDQLVALLARAAAPHPVLTGETGAGRTALVVALAGRIAANDVPMQLRGRNVFSLDLTALVSSARDAREVEQRMRAVLDEAARARAIMFVDNLPTLAGTGAAHGAVVNALLTDALAVATHCKFYPRSKSS